MNKEHIEGSADITRFGAVIDDTFPLKMVVGIKFSKNKIRDKLILHHMNSCEYKFNSGLIRIDSEKAMPISINSLSKVVSFGKLKTMLISIGLK